MKNLLTLLIFTILAGIPITVQAQRWSPEEQEFLDYYKKICEKFETVQVFTHESWKEMINPTDDMTIWLTSQSMPFNLESLEKWHKSYAAILAKFIYVDARPIKIKIVDSLALIWFYTYGEIVDKAGNRNAWEDMRLEIFQKKDGQWHYIGGMIDQIDPF